jgi:hypothetical protein
VWVEVEACPLDRLREKVVERRKDVAGRGVVALRELLDHIGVTVRAILRRHHGRDELTVMCERVRVTFSGLMAADTSDAR